MTEYELMQDYNNLLMKLAVLQNANTKEEINKTYKQAKVKLDEIYKDKLKLLKESH